MCGFQQPPERWRNRCGKIQLRLVMEDAFVPPERAIKYFLLEEVCIINESNKVFIRRRHLPTLILYVWAYLYTRAACAVTWKARILENALIRKQPTSELLLVCWKHHYHFYNKHHQDASIASYICCASLSEILGEQTILNTTYML